ncbi:MAG TPA: hypothetical protein PLM93_09965 [Sulfuricurvum sp.]|nr:MAG: hypothetical protein B7Y30_03585 [Campylobacterales bacterium 16-40-21]OZA02592.1 MAG: hypothetical protein B7X89_08615 [Sulfuricurvum sp. 17-40-25]HQS67494.1 hypothetical protein [Sulfuricurvum sp.]HQT36334.1 hypothetical protein [Sulfuricurvum sp.]
MNKIASTQLHIYSPTIDNNPVNTPIVDHNGEILYYAKPPDDDLKYEDQFDLTHYSNFTFVLNKGGTLWEEANLYLLNMIEDDAGYSEETRISYKTVAAHAKALQDYKFFCDLKDDEHELSEEDRKTKAFWMIAKRPTNRPNFKYKEHLEKRMLNQELTPSTVKKMIRPITSFYEFVQRELGMTFETTMPGKKFGAIIDTGNGNGIFVEGNEANRVRGATNFDDGYIRDVGKLRPLDEGEQAQLFKVLHDDGQPEMILSHTFAYLTAARMDTVFTLRLNTFINSLPQDYSDAAIRQWYAEQKQMEPYKEYDVMIGTGTLIDAKGTVKNYELKVPGYLIQMLRVYIVSERAKKRREAMRHKQANPLHEYVFITDKGQPYYVAKSDPHKSKYKNPPDGGAVRVFKTNVISKQIRFEYSFHFLRATCLMNLIRTHQKLVADGVWTTDQLECFVQKRAGHQNKATTQKYLKYKYLEKHRAEAIEIRAAKLLSWIGDMGVANNGKTKN